MQFRFLHSVLLFLYLSVLLKPNFPKKLQNTWFSHTLSHMKGKASEKVVIKEGWLLISIVLSTGWSVIIVVLHQGLQSIDPICPVHQPWQYATARQGVRSDHLVPDPGCC